MSDGSIGGVHRDPQLVATELAVGLGVHDPVGPQHLRDRCRVDRVVEVDGADHQRAVVGVDDVRSGVRRPLGPAVERVGGGRGPLDHPLEPALGVHPFELLGHQEERGDRRGVVGLVQAGVVDRDLQVEEGRDVATRAGDLVDPRDGPGGHRSDPQATVGGEGLLRGEVVGVGLVEVDRQAAGARGGVDQDERVVSGALGADDRRHHGGRGLVVRPGVDIDSLFGDGDRAAARLALDHGRHRQPRGSRRSGAELGGELAEGQVLALLPD